ncbi:hypothetical protein ACJX0J_026386, partial [Zea mays]
VMCFCSMSHALLSIMFSSLRLPTFLYIAAGLKRAVFMNIYIFILHFLLLHEKFFKSKRKGHEVKDLLTSSKIILKLCLSWKKHRFASL